MCSKNLGNTSLNVLCLGGFAWIHAFVTEIRVWNHVECCVLGIFSPNTTQEQSPNAIFQIYPWMLSSTIRDVLLLLDEDLDRVHLQGT